MIDAKLSCGQISHLVTDFRVSMSNQGEFRSSLSNLLLLTMIMMMIIMLYQRGWDTCVPTPKMAYFSVLKAFLFLKYFKNNLGLTESSFNP